MKNGTTAHITYRGRGGNDEGLGLDPEGLGDGPAFPVIGEIVRDCADVPEPVAGAALEEV